MVYGVIGRTGVLVLSHVTQGSILDVGHVTAHQHRTEERTACVVLSKRIYVTEMSR